MLTQIPFWNIFKIKKEKYVKLANQERKAMCIMKSHLYSDILKMAWSLPYLQLRCSYFHPSRLKIDNNEYSVSDKWYNHATNKAWHQKITQRSCQKQSLLSFYRRIITPPSHSFYMCEKVSKSQKKTNFSFFLQNSDISRN